jgi:hypothetical protein
MGYHKKIPDFLFQATGKETMGKPKVKGTRTQLETCKYGSKKL